MDAWIIKKSGHARSFHVSSLPLLLRRSKQPNLHNSSVRVECHWLQTGEPSFNLNQLISPSSSPFFLPSLSEMSSSSISSTAKDEAAKRRFKLYSCYAWGIPALIVICGHVMDQFEFLEDYRLPLGKESGRENDFFFFPNGICLFVFQAELRLHFVLDQQPLRLGPVLRPPAGLPTPGKHCLLSHHGHLHIPSK